MAISFRTVVYNYYLLLVCLGKEPCLEKFGLVGLLVLITCTQELVSLHDMKVLIKASPSNIVLG